MAIKYGKSTFAAGVHYYNIPVAGDCIVDCYFLKTPFDLDNKALRYQLDTSNRIDRVDNIKITNDGLQLYVCETFSAGIGGDVLNYKMSLPFRIDTATYDYTVSSLYSVEATCFEITNDGNTFYYNSGGTLVQFNLSTPYDIRTRTQTGSYGGFLAGGGPGDPAFSPDGTKLVIGARGRSYIEGGTCSTPFDISTYTQTSTLNTSDADPSCCKWNSDGTKLFVRHSSPDMVNEFTTTNPYSLSGMSFTRQVYNNPSYAAGGHDFNYDF